MSSLTVVSTSGGKDSTAMICLAIERGESPIYVFADTGHEHELTYEYIDYLEKALNITIERVRADFSGKFAHKREFIRVKWAEQGIDQARIDEALEYLQPTGNPFLDLCLWKGRFPSTRRRFCSEELKHNPIDDLMDEYLAEYDEVISWQGVRRDESRQRANLVEEEDHPTKQGLTWYRPILDWTAQDTFDMHDKHGIDPNPLYKLGMGRVGCMPCIHAGKKEIFEIARRFPEEVARIVKWEQLVSKVSKGGASMFLDARVTSRFLGTPATVEHIKPETHGIETYIEWSKTAHGGKQADLIKTVEFQDAPMCSSIYGLCE